MAAATSLEIPQIDALIVANHVEAINGLLYLSGGGWTDLHRRILDGSVPSSHFGIGMAVRVAWHETNKKHHYVVEVQADDTQQAIVHTEGDISVGQPPQLARGSVQHAIVAISIDMTFPKAGSYRIVATIGGNDETIWAFRVHDTYR